MAHDEPQAAGATKLVALATEDLRAVGRTAAAAGLGATTGPSPAVSAAVA